MPAATDIDKYHEALADEDRAICDALRAVVERHLPDAQAKVWHGHPVWFLAGNPIVGYSKRKQAVQVLFWSGGSFATPGLAPEGTFKAAGVDYTEPGQIDVALLGRWLDEARAVQWDYKNIVKRRGVLERLS